MISIQVNDTCDENWNSRLLKSTTGSIYHTKEYSEFVKHKSWSPKFLTFLDNNDKIVGQLLVSTYSRFNKKKVITRPLKFIPNVKKEFCRWIYGPVIFTPEVKNEINLALQKFVQHRNYFVIGSEHPLSKNNFSQIKNSFQKKNEYGLLSISKGDYISRTTICFCSKKKRTRKSLKTHIRKNIKK